MSCDCGFSFTPVLDATHTQKVEILCRSCGKSLRVPRLEGKRILVRCPRGCEEFEVDFRPRDDWAAHSPSGRGRSGTAGNSGSRPSPLFRLAAQIAPIIVLITFAFMLRGLPTKPKVVPDPQHRPSAESRQKLEPSFFESERFRSVESPPSKKRAFFNQWEEDLGEQANEMDTKSAGTETANLESKIANLPRAGEPPLQSHSTHDAFTYSELPAASIEREALIPVPLPSTGHVRHFVTAAPVSPFRIMTQVDGFHHVVKLTNWKTDKDILTVFVRAGETAEIEVPLGTFRMKEATGAMWYGDDQLFGPETVYSKADDPFKFDEAHEIEVTLYPVVHGNLETTPISASEW